MTIDVTWRALHNSAVATESAQITTTEDIGPLLARLEGTFGARLLHRDRDLLPSGLVDHDVIVGVRDGRAVMLYSDGDIGGWVTVGDNPNTEITYLEYDFPPHSELPLSIVERAVEEFRVTGTRPTCVEWQVAE
ncbi:Imm1 family immunity protein [Allokutzneria sp. A3M-2-11 16]|uniref:Imm1 family immunity protein n=1 Tax=Allokutzneria sp. A3M-2-11 16 TaxID=2962043 RepID=UPI0020B718D1|nr:Imm1 family immunity protein [Allokutzneria sp. A3M-2-11 16]MCP3804006.1 Imm1 family immunity protein [Allokutzneria sp. A3M-2-11 16]